jgi:hypothetical protein
MSRLRLPALFLLPDWPCCGGRETAGRERIAQLIPGP